MTKLKPLACVSTAWHSSVSKSQKARSWLMRRWCGCHLALAFLSTQDCAQRTNSLPVAAVRHHPLRVELKYSTTIIGTTCGGGGGRLGRCSRSEKISASSTSSSSSFWVQNLQSRLHICISKQLSQSACVWKWNQSRPWTRYFIPSSHRRVHLHLLRLF